MKFRNVLLVCFVASSAVVSVTVAIAPVTASPAGDDAPFAEAGLDQDAAVGDRVFLDAGGSRASSGTLSGYNWSITGPNGTTFAPSCRECVRTDFVPNRSGRYAITVTVTDEEGRTDSDTMYVDVGVAAVPEITLSGPRRVGTGRSATFTATVEPGDAELTRVTWLINGTRVANSTLNGGRIASLERTFDEPGYSAVTATVHDGAGRTRSAVHHVRVADSGGGGSSDSGFSLSIRGPRVLTGEKPFNATYSIAGEDAADVESVTWHDGDGDERGVGARIETSWDAGTHELFGVAQLDTDTVRVTFENGTKVVADPRPRLSLSATQDDSTLAGSISARDEFGNLESVTLLVDDDPVREWSPENGSAFETPFSVDLNADKTSSRVRAVATDDRDQVRTDSNEAGEPELVRAGFVNDPVDSYHERIDSDRYTAVHETVIDLNGVDPSEVSLRVAPSSEDPGLQKLHHNNREYNEISDDLVVRNKWAGNVPGEFQFESLSSDVRDTNSTLQVTSSPPEVHIEVLDEGEDSHLEAHLLHIDVSESFDPDGSKLEFSVQDRDRYGDNPDEIGIEFSDKPGLTVTDQQGNSVELSSELYDYWSPDIATVEEKSEGPYEAGEQIEFRVETEKYQPSDPEYPPSFELSVEDGSGTVSEWRETTVGSGTGPDSAPKEYNQWKYVGTVRVDADSYLKPQRPSLKVVNPNQRAQSANWRLLPDVDVFRAENLKRTNVEITDLEYVENPTQRSKVVTSPRQRIRYASNGYSVERTSRELNAITLEKKQRTELTVVDSKTFSNKEDRDWFLFTHPAWSPGGTEQKSTKRVQTEWRDTRHGPGQFTGETRSKTVCSEGGIRKRHGGCKPIDATEQKTQYRHIFHRISKETMYVAKKHETEEHWVNLMTIDPEDFTSQLTKREDVRVGQRHRSTKWHMSKYVDETTVSGSYDKASNVVETRTVVEGDITYHSSNWHGEDSGEVHKEQFRGATTFEGAISKQEIIEKIKDGSSLSPVRCSSGDQMDC